MGVFVVSVAWSAGRGRSQSSRLEIDGGRCRAGQGLCFGPSGLALPIDDRRPHILLRVMDNDRFDPSMLTRDFRTKVTVCECGCWVFRATDRSGYARFKFRGRNLIGHRFAYDRLVGEIPDGMDLDHLCDRHRNCVNPAHLEPVSKSENARRANRRRWDRVNSSPED